MRAARHTDGEQARSKGMLTEDEGCATCSATLLRVGVREQCTFSSDSINVWSLVPHDSVIVGTDIMNTDIIAPENNDVWLLASLRC